MDNRENITLQTKFLPFDAIDQVVAHLASVSSAGIKWNYPIILIDDPHFNTVFCLVDSKLSIQAALRFNLTPDSTLLLLREIFPNLKDIKLAIRRNYKIHSEELRDMPKLQQVLENASYSILKKINITTIYSAPSDDIRKTGRGASVTTSTKRRVIIDGCGRCMFEGCGEQLDIDELTGESGNYGYLAHIIASSESGPRGARQLSKKLSNKPENIMLFCDKHHRLIDKIAVADFPVERLNEMRQRFIETTREILNYLAYSPAKAFYLLWPISGQLLCRPTPVEVSRCLATSRLRLSGEIRNIGENNYHSDGESEEFWSFAPMHIRAVAATITQTASDTGQVAGLFALGPMPMLVGLGSMIGNKSRIIPMPRFRDSELWIWSRKDPVGDFFQVEGIKHLSQKEKHIVLSLCLTACPPAISNAATKLRNALGAKHVIIRADNPGNACLGHPEDGMLFQNRMQNLLNILKTEHNTEFIHLLPCASNAACVFFGKSIEHCHPEILVYDFERNAGVDQPGMIVRLRIIPESSGTKIKKVDVANIKNFEKLRRNKTWKDSSGGISYSKQNPQA